MELLYLQILPPQSLPLLLEGQRHTQPKSNSNLFFNKAEHAVQSYAVGVKHLSMEGFENVGAC